MIEGGDHVKIGEIALDCVHLYPSSIAKLAQTVLKLYSERKEPANLHGSSSDSLVTKYTKSYKMSDI